VRKLRLYLDDQRPLPDDGFDFLIRTVEDAIKYINQNAVEFISLDNDLGVGYTEGYKVADYIEHAYICGDIEFVDFMPHTNNPGAARRMWQARENVYKHKAALEAL